MKKKLLIVSSDFSLENGGIQNTSYLLAQHLNSYFDVYTYCLSNGNSPNIDGVVSAKSTHRKWKYSVFDCLKLCKRYRFDYALATTWNSSQCLFFLKIKYHVPYGIMTHGNEVLPYEKVDIFRNVSLLPQIVSRYLVFKLANHIFANSQYTKTLVERLIKSKSVHIIHPPISMLPSYSINGNGVIPHKLLTISRLEERKGIQNVLFALKEVVKLYPDVEYTVAGEGQFESYLKDLVKQLNLERNTRFLGKVSEYKKKCLLEKCGIYILPSFFNKTSRSVEGFGLSLIEANSYGKFVISSVSGGIPDAVLDNKTGVLVRENNIEDLCNAILQAFDKGFKYNPNDCYSWAKIHHISHISTLYANTILGT